MSQLEDAFRKQAWHCGNLDSPFMERWCHLMADRLTPNGTVARMLFDWQSDPSHRASAVPLRFAGALHALVLQGADDSLKSVYPPNSVDDDSLWIAIDQAMTQHADFILDWMKSPPQTNEVRRANALIPAFHLIAATTGLPLKTSEIGASAGLNLGWDAFEMHIGGNSWGPANSAVQLSPDWEGDLPPIADINIVDRAGCDLNPLDPGEDADRLRLLAYLWADQIERKERTEAAADLAVAAQHKVYQQDALDFLEDRLANPLMDTAHVIYHSIMWQYLPDFAKSKGTEIIRAAGEQATKASPLFWLSYEGDGKDKGAAITLQMWPSGQTVELARADFHGRWVKWNKVETLV